MSTSMRGPFSTFVVNLSMYQKCICITAWGFSEQSSSTVDEQGVFFLLTLNKQRDYKERKRTFHNVYEE
jgi:hypothetical protein